MYRILSVFFLAVSMASLTLAQTTLSTGVPTPFQYLPQGSPALFNGEQGFQIEVPASAAGLLVRVVTQRAESTLSFHLRRNTDVVFGVGGIDADISVNETEDARVWTRKAETLTPGTYFIAISAGPYQADLRGTIYATVLAAPTSPAAEFDVPGTSAILLAGQGIGTELGSVASAPENSPVLVPVPIEPGQRIRLTANGTIDSTRTGNNIPPEGQLSNIDALGEEFGLSGINGPRDALVGVFLGDVIDDQGTPPLLQFRGGGIQEDVLEPLLQQTFYVGNGFTADGRQREFVAPPGATRLFLGTKSVFPRTITGLFHVSLVVDPAEQEPAGRNPLRVPAIAHLSLAGQPAGANSSFHTVHLNSPPRVAIALEAGQRLQFTVRGQIQHRIQGDLPPSGASNSNANAGLSNGFSGLVAPQGGLIGVFTADVVDPDTVPTRLTFDAELQAEALLLPELQQMFYIGDGFTPGGERRTVVVPPGATHLYLATHDTNNYFDAGAFLVAVSVDDPAAPIVPADGLVHGASFRTGPTAPGTIASIFGQNLADETVLNGDVPLPSLLAGVQVFFDNHPAALYFVSPLQINVQVPWQLKDRTRAWLTVVRNGVAGDPAEVEIAPFSGGIFDVAGLGPIVINNRTGRLVSADEPARSGDALIVYTTGLGPVAPEFGTGAPPPPTLTHATFGLEAILAGRTIQPFFVGGAPGFVGIIQVNFTVPEDVPSGPATLRFQSPGFGDTQEVTIFVE